MCLSVFRWRWRKWRIRSREYRLSRILYYRATMKTLLPAKRKKTETQVLQCRKYVYSFLRHTNVHKLRKGFSRKLYCMIITLPRISTNFQLKISLYSTCSNSIVYGPPPSERLGSYVTDIAKGNTAKQRAEAELTQCNTQVRGLGCMWMLNSPSRVPPLSPFPFLLFLTPFLLPPPPLLHLLLSTSSSSYCCRCSWQH